MEVTRCGFVCIGLEVGVCFGGVGEQVFDKWHNLYTEV